MEKDILLGGEKELRELRKTLLEKERYSSVIDSLKKEVDTQKQTIEFRTQEIEQEVVVEVQRRREAMIKPYYDKIVICEASIQRIQEERERKRQELIDNICKEEAEVFEEQKKELEEQIKQVRKDENIPAICMSRPFLAFFCPRTGLDALILVSGIILLLLIMPMGIYFGVYGGDNKLALTTIYLVTIIVFYTVYLLINNLVKDKYLVGLKRVLELMAETEKLEIRKKKRMVELENIPDEELDLQEFDEQIIQLRAEIAEVEELRNLAVINFDSDERLKMDIAAQVQQRYAEEMGQMRNALADSMSSLENMKQEYEKFVEEQGLKEKYTSLARMERSIFDIKVIDELLFILSNGDAENIGGAILRRKRKMENVTF